MLDGSPLTGARIADVIRLAVNADDVAKEELRALKDAIEQDTKEDVVTFSFVTADYVRDFRGKTLPRCQELFLKGNLVKHKVSKLHAYTAMPGQYSSSLIAGSREWRQTWKASNCVPCRSICGTTRT